MSNVSHAWPRIGCSVMVKVGSEKNSEWVDSYITAIPPVGIVVKTYWGRELHIMNPSDVCISNPDKGSVKFCSVRKLFKDSAIPQAKMLRVFEFINLLSMESYTIKALANRMDVSLKTAYRYIDLLEDLGFQIVSDDSRYRIGTDHLSCLHQRFQKKGGSQWLR